MAQKRREYQFFQLDVFTNQPFGGNPLAVFPDATGLSADDMQSLAREMNLSETTFVLPSMQPNAHFRVRIFTPDRELPFAGHPVIGTHWILAHLGRVQIHEPVTVVRFELGVGVRAALLHVNEGKVLRVTMDHQTPQFYATANQDQVNRLARSLNLIPEAVQATDWPVQVVSTGIRQLFVPVRSLKEVQALDGNQIDAGLLAQVCRELDTVEACNDTVMVLTLETLQTSSDVHTRVFTAAHGVVEDPATGSASGGLGAYLVQHQIVKATPPTTNLTAEQGIEIGRPSRIGIEIDGEPGNLSMARVSGEAVPLIEGIVRW